MAALEAIIDPPTDEPGRCDGHPFSVTTAGVICSNVKSGSGHRLSRTPALTRAALTVQSDDRLVALARAGSDAAFATIVERYRRPLLRHSARILGPSGAEDMVQQAFTNLYVQLRDDARPLQLKPWLFRVAHNLTLNAATKKGGDHAELVDDIDGVLQPPQVAELRARLGATVELIRALPERQRLALVRRELEGRSCEEIADEFGTSSPAVRQLLARARSAVRDGVGLVLPFPVIARMAGAGKTGGGDSAAGLLSAQRAAEVVAGAGALGGGAVKMAVTVAALTAATGIGPSSPSADGEPASRTGNASVVVSAGSAVVQAGSDPSPPRRESVHRHPPNDPRPPVHRAPGSPPAEPLPEAPAADPPPDRPSHVAVDKPDHSEPAAEDAPADEVIEEPELPYEEDAPPVDAGDQEPPPGSGDGEAPSEWQPVVAREAEAAPPAAVEALEDAPVDP
jgi:RNA polymerase sigma factor (sigma-70 family)